MAGLFVGLDGGQSGTRAVLADESGHVLSIGHGPACDHLTGPNGYSINAAAIHGAIGDALTKAHAATGDVVAVGMGLTTAPREIAAQPTFEKIVREIADPAHIWVDHDAATNLAGATAGEPGLMVIGGSGSISYGLNADGKEGIAGGLGYLMGDEGSAWWIGINALQAAARAADGRGPQTRLLPYALEHFSIPTIRHLHLFLYSDEFTRPSVSGITVDVARLAAEDEVAREIMTTAGEKLAGLVLAVIRQIHSPGEDVDVYPTGGVFRAGEVVMSPFGRTLSGAWPEITIREPKLEPVYGALIRGYQAAGITVSDNMLTNLRAGPSR